MRIRSISGVMRRNTFCFIMMSMVMLFRYLPMWNLISTNQRYLFLPVILIFFVFYAINKKLDKRKMLIICLVVLFGFIDFFISSEIDVLMSLLLAAMYMFDDGDKMLVRHFCIASIIFYFLTIVLSSFGVVENTQFVRTIDGYTTIRNTLGFTNPNHAFTLLISIFLCAYLGFKISDKKYLFVALILTIGFIIFSLTDCRTGFYSVVIFAFLILIADKIKKKIIFKGKLLFPVFTVLSIVVAYLFGSSDFMNKLLTGRPRIWSSNIEQLPISIFGNDITKMDNSYLFLIYRHGILIYFLYLFVYYNAAKYFIRNKKLMIVLIVFLLYSVFENMLNYAFNPIFILALLYYMNNDIYKMYCYEPLDRANKD